MWGRFTSTSNGTTVVLFPDSFATQCFIVLSDGVKSGGAESQDNAAGVDYGSISQTGFSVFSADDSSNACGYIALGVGTMAVFFSPSSLGFFDDAVHDVLPDDAVPISADRHRELLAAQASGATITADSNGKPRASRPSVDSRRAAALRQVKREAARRIEAIAPLWRQLNDQRAPTTESDARFAAIDGIRVASDLIEQNVVLLSASAIDVLDIPAHPFWPAE